MKALFVYVLAGLASVAFAQNGPQRPGGGGRPGGDNRPGDNRPGDKRPGDNKPGDNQPSVDRPADHHPLVRLLDGEWEGRFRTRYDFSDVEVGEELVTFDVSRKQRLGQWQHGGRFGNAERAESAEVTCRGTGTYNRESKLVHILEVCPTHRKPINKTTVLTLKLDFSGGYRGGRIELEGKKFEYTVYVDVNGGVTIVDRTQPEEIKLTRDRERDNGPIHRRPHHGGGGPRPN